MNRDRITGVYIDGPYMDKLKNKKLKKLDAILKNQQKAKQNKKDFPQTPGRKAKGK
jgi:hypothetical protein